MAAVGFLKLGIPLKVSTQIDGYNILFIASTFVEYYLRAQESYRREPATMDWIRTFIQPDDVVYDVGANVGAYSLLLGKVVSDGAGVVYSFEPEALNCSALNKNIVLNGLTDKVVAYAICLGDRTRVGSFFLSSTIAGSALHSIDRPESDGQMFVPQHMQGVAIFSLNEFVCQPHIRFPNHIKIDVDGTEKQVVENMDQLLQDPRLKTVMIEINRDLDDGVIERIFGEAGFNLRVKEQWPGKNIINAQFVRNAL
jgi:FkbM family methyltransferase